MPDEYHVRVSRELLPPLRQWSSPVQMRIVGEDADSGEMAMEFRVADGSSRDVELRALRNVVELAIVRFGILRDRMEACEADHPDTHRVSLFEIPDWIDEARTALAAREEEGR